MGKKDKSEKNKESRLRQGFGEPKKKEYLLTSHTKRTIKAILMFLAAVIAVLSFLGKAGQAGQLFTKTSTFLTGNAIFTLPLFLILGGFMFLKTTKKKVKGLSLVIAMVVSIIGIAGILGAYDLTKMQGGWIGFLSAKLLVGSFGLLVGNIVFSAIILIGLFIFLQFIWAEFVKEAPVEPGKDVLKSTDSPNLKIRGVMGDKPFDSAQGKKPEGRPSIFKKIEDKTDKPQVVTLMSAINKGKYSLPPIDLLSKNETSPTSGNIKENSLIIKKTLENFGIPVEMAEVNVGPTVTQYAFKPAEGVKLSKITTLSNNLALALAAHPIRIEAPIPGKSLVGIEVPNKVRATVVLRNLIADQQYQTSDSPLMIAMGKDVSGAPIYTALEEQPHMLVAGATGTGKTIFLNSLILSMMYKSTPEQLRLIMVDPKRVEFQHYNEIPHLLCPVINDAAKTINALQWLAKEMERRFEVFSEIPTRNLRSYNSHKAVIAAGKQLPYIVLVVDELADLMAAKGKELEAGIVRLAQMARATGIHLVLATQRPSVEVITGLIKANISSRISFQVASQIDSRTVLDISGAEKLIGMGDMLFLSAKSSKITRVQGPYVSENEVKRVTDWIVDMGKKVQEPQGVLIESLKASLEQAEQGEEKSGGDVFFGDDDPLFEDVKRIVLETKKASASFLQRRLRIGYSRAARLIDMLEDKGIVGAADGAKPREVYGDPGTSTADLSGGTGLDESEELPKENGDWQKV